MLIGATSGSPAKSSSFSMVELVTLRVFPGFCKITAYLICKIPSTDTSFSYERGGMLAGLLESLSEFHHWQLLAPESPGLGVLVH